MDRNRLIRAFALATIALSVLTGGTVHAARFAVEAARARRYFSEEADPNTAVPYPTDDSWTRYGLIAHGLGGLAGRSRPNSGDAFARSYAAGFRVFEVDFLTTSDGHLVAGYDWPEGRAPTLAAFRSDGAYSGLTAGGLADLLTRHPDAWLVLDLKGDFASQLAAWVEIAPPSVLDRTIPQLYAERDLSIALSLYPFRSFIYTLYRSGASDDAVVDFVARSGVSVVTMSRSRFSGAFTHRLREAGASVWIHTVNDARQADRYLDEGAAGLYTDSLIPRTFFRFEHHSSSSQ